MTMSKCGTSPWCVSVDTPSTIYSFQGSCFGTVGGFALSAASLGCYYTAQRRVIHPGHFGHYISSGRHMLVLPGIHSLVSLTDRWAEPAEVAMDDETNHVRAFGSKTVMIVPENHVGGAFRIGKHSDEGEDGEFVLFGELHGVSGCTAFITIHSCRPWSPCST